MGKISISQDATLKKLIPLLWHLVLAVTDSDLHQYLQIGFERITLREHVRIVLYISLQSDSPEIAEKIFGQVIGRQGAIIKAIRHVVTAAAYGYRGGVAIELLEGRYQRMQARERLVPFFSVNDPES